MAAKAAKAAKAAGVPKAEPKIQLPKSPTGTPLSPRLEYTIHHLRFPFGDGKGTSSGKITADEAFLMFDNSRTGSIARTYATRAGIWGKERSGIAHGCRARANCVQPLT